MADSETHRTDNGRPPGRLAESFADIDAAIAAAEAEADELDWPPEDEADEDEVARVQAEIAAARAESAARRRGAVA